MDIFRKIAIYRRLLILFWCINVMLITLTLIAGVRYFSELPSDAPDFARSLDLRLTELSLAKQDGEDALFEFRKKIEGTQSLVSQFPDIELLPASIRDFSQEKKWKYSPLEIKNLRIQLLSWLRDTPQNSNRSRLTKELFALGVTSLFIGILLPLFVVWQLSKALMSAKRQLEEKLIQWAGDIMLAIKGADGFGDPLVWIDILAASLEALPLKHPLLLTLRGLLPAIRAEYVKKQTATPINLKPKNWTS